jgi:hypothetical protein
VNGDRSSPGLTQRPDHQSPFTDHQSRSATPAPAISEKVSFIPPPRGSYSRSFLFMKPTRTLPYPLLKTIAGSLAALLLGTLPGRAQLPLQENDVVAIIGNALGDRMQHDGWVETVIQSKMAGKKLRFRNLAIVGDSVAHRPRHQGFDTPEKSLTNCKADVIFAFFGYNESFAGEGGLAKFKTDLAAMVDKYRGSQFNGKSAPRIVLFSPIAHENRKSPNLPNGAANNVNLALYTAAIKQVAEEKGHHAGALHGGEDAADHERHPPPARGQPSARRDHRQRAHRPGRDRAGRGPRTAAPGGAGQGLALAQPLSRDGWQRHLGQPLGVEICERPDQRRRAPARADDARRHDREP